MLSLERRLKIIIIFHEIQKKYMSINEAHFKWIKVIDQIIDYWPYANKKFFYLYNVFQLTFSIIVFNGQVKESR